MVTSKKFCHLMCSTIWRRIKNQINWQISYNFNAIRMRSRLQNVDLSVAGVYEHWLLDILFNEHGCIAFLSFILKMFALGNPQVTLNPKPKETVD